MSARAAGDGGGMGASADAGDALAGPGHTPCQPVPTGPYPAGTASVWLTDCGCRNLRDQAIFVNHAPGAIAPLDPELIQIRDAVGQLP